MPKCIGMCWSCIKTLINAFYMHVQLVIGGCWTSAGFRWYWLHIMACYILTKTSNIVVWEDVLLTKVCKDDLAHSDFKLQLMQVDKDVDSKIGDDLKDDGDNIHPELMGSMLDTLDDIFQWLRKKLLFVVGEMAGMPLITSCISSPLLHFVTTTLCLDWGCAKLTKIWIFKILDGMLPNLPDCVVTHLRLLCHGQLLSHQVLILHFDCHLWAPTEAAWWCFASLSQLTLSSSPLWDKAIHNHLELIHPWSFSSICQKSGWAPFSAPNNCKVSIQMVPPLFDVMHSYILWFKNCNATVMMFWWNGWVSSK